MEFRIISLPPFEAVTSGVSEDYDFSPAGVLGKFGEYFSAITPSARDSFMPRDFLFHNREKNGLEWWWALAPDMPDGGYEHVQFDGGMYLTYFYTDHDEAENARLYRAALDFIAAHEYLELDERANHYSLGHIITPAELIAAQGIGQMEALVPVKLKNKSV